METKDMVCWNCYWSTQEREEAFSIMAEDQGDEDSVLCEALPSIKRIGRFSGLNAKAMGIDFHLENPHSYSCGQGRWCREGRWVGRLDAEDMMDDYEDRHDIKPEYEPWPGDGEEADGTKS